MGAISSERGRREHAPRILIYDDDVAYGVALHAMLTEAGFAVQAVSHFQQALTALEGNEPVDLLIADIVIPAGVNGLAMSRMARMRNREIKVIFMTAYDLQNVNDDASIPVLRKPLGPAELIDAVRLALSR
jgi:DNA-binding response OmpR family regulator